MLLSRATALLFTATFLGAAGAFTAPAKPFGVRTASRVGSSTELFAAPSVEDLKGAQEMIDGIIDEKNCGPIFVRLAWHDSGTFDKALADEEWPAAGGAIGSIRFDPEITHGANAGLVNAVNLLAPVQEKFPSVTFADIYQMASVRSIEKAGGPKIAMRYGRQDASGPVMCSKEGNLPDAEPNPETGEYGGDGGTASTRDTTPNGHLRKVFYRMGLSDEDIVALSGAHTFGRAYKDRSGLGADKTKFTDGKFEVKRGDGQAAKYTPGGSSWVEQWLIFDNSYFTTMKDQQADPELLKLSTDKTLFDDEDFAPFAEKFAASQSDFFESYAAAHSKLSELGSKFEPAEGIKID